MTCITNIIKYGQGSMHMPIKAVESVDENCLADTTDLIGKFDKPR